MKGYAGTLLGFFCFFFGNTLFTQEQTPSSRRYDEVCFLVSHNSYAATEHGYCYAQQTLSIKRQLALGVRGLMLDIFDDPHNGIVLCHRSHFITRLICRGKAPMPLKEALLTIKEFLTSHPQEIITIFLENYIRESITLDTVLREAHLEKIILSPSEWNPQEQGWPTIKWMQNNNKRLVIFNAQGDSELTFNEWKHVAENQWGVLDPLRACSERPESKALSDQPRRLLLLNYFPKFKFNFLDPYSLINTQKLDEFIKRALHKGLNTGSCKGRLPNFICLDQVHIGNGTNHVQKINDSFSHGVDDAYCSTKGGAYR